MRMTLVVHILASSLGLIFGYVALYAAKGSRLHRRGGMLFVLAGDRCHARGVGGRSHKSHLRVRGARQRRHEERDAGISVLHVWCRRAARGCIRCSGHSAGGASLPFSTCTTSVAHVLRAVCCRVVVLHRPGQTVSGAAVHHAAPCASGGGRARDHVVLALAHARQAERSGRRWRRLSGARVK